MPSFSLEYRGQTIYSDTIAGLIDIAVSCERARCLAIARNGANFVRDKPVKFVAAEEYAADLADDIADAIESGEEP